MIKSMNVNFRVIGASSYAQINCNACMLSYPMGQETLIICINGIFRNRENLQNKKTADSLLLSRFMGINGKCNSLAP